MQYSQLDWNTIKTEPEPLDQQKILHTHTWIVVGALSNKNVCVKNEEQVARQWCITVLTFYGGEKIDPVFATI